MFIKVLLDEHGGNKLFKRMPRMATIPGISVDDYRALQLGKTVEVDGETGDYLIRHGYAEAVTPEKVKKEEEE
jgi:hypothetical protein